MTGEQIDAIYGSFGEAGQDMTKAEFHRQVRELTDPKRMADEAHSLAKGSMNRKAIDRKIHASDL